MSAKPSKNKCYWRICGYDGLIQIFERTVGLGQFNENQIKQLLMTLAAKEGLKHDEIVGAYAKRGTRIANDLLIVHKEFRYRTYWCGDDPHFVASVVDETGKITPNRRLPGEPTT
jgi:hypothetical protein